MLAFLELPHKLSHCFTRFRVGIYQELCQSSTAHLLKPLGQPKEDDSEMLGDTRSKEIMQVHGKVELPQLPQTQVYTGLCRQDLSDTSRWDVRNGTELSRV